MEHMRGSSSPAANCTPHVTQIQASIRCLLLIHFFLSLLFYHRSGALQHISSQERENEYLNGSLNTKITMNDVTAKTVTVAGEVHQSKEFFGQKKQTLSSHSGH